MGNKQGNTIENKEMKEKLHIFGRYQNQLEKF